MQAPRGPVTTIRDVARHARVSVGTVSYVINGTHYVSPELRKRVLDAIETFNYRQTGSRAP